MALVGLCFGLVGLCMSGGTPAQASVVLQENVPLDTPPLLNPCNGELVSLSGTTHIVVTATFDSAGNAVIGTHQNLHDISGLGLTTCTTYTAQEILNEHEFSGQLPLTMTVESDTLLVSQGSAPNFVLHTLIHTSIDASGNATSWVDSPSTTCQ